MSRISKSIKKIFINNILKNAKNEFINILVKETKYDLKTIKSLFDSFDKIHNNIPCAHSYFELFIIYAMILTLPVKGPIVELGCYKGGSSAKLSLICKLTGRKLYIFDSFEGLPEPEKIDLKHSIVPWIAYEKEAVYNKGMYYGSLDDVKNNIKKYGCIDVCQFYKGFFKETIPDFKITASCIIMDVDLIQSARTVLRFLWPQLKSDGLLFTHESGVIDFIESITDINWWEKELNQKPPILYGAGYGANWRYGNLAFPSNIAYFKKQH